MTEDGALRLARGRPFTVDDLAATPDDGNRYELIDGMLLASPPPDLRHQKVVLTLAGVLDRACPPGMDMILGPYAVRPSDITELRPDIVVARDEDIPKSRRRWRSNSTRPGSTTR